MSNRAWDRRRGRRRTAVHWVTSACRQAGIPLERRNALVRLFRQGDRATRLWVNQQIDQAITRQLETTNIPQLLLARGQTIVLLDDQGRMIEHRPDGTTTVLNQPRRDEALARILDGDQRLLARLELAVVPSYYGNQWDLFEIHCADFHVAGRYAARQNWWLHCWKHVPADHADPRVAVVGDPQPPWVPVPDDALSYWKQLLIARLGDEFEASYDVDELKRRGRGRPGRGAG